MPVKTSLKNTFNYTNSVLSFVVLGFFFEPAIFTSYFSQNIRDSIFGIPILLFFITLRFLFFSGAYGTLVEIASDENLTLSIKSFQNNLKQYWKLYLAVSIIPMVVHFLIFSLAPFKNIPYIGVSTFLDTVILYIIASSIINKKYLKKLDIIKKKLNITLSDIIVILSVLGVSLGLVAFAYTAEVKLFHIYRVVHFAIKYLHFFLFFYITFIILKTYKELNSISSSEKELYLIAPKSAAVIPSILSLILRIYPPVFTVLRAMTPESYKIREFNQIIWRKRFYQPKKLVGITCFTSNSPEAYKIAKSFREKGSKVIMGGPHVSFCADEALEYCDSVVIGEAEGVWEEIIHDYENDCLKPKYIAPILDNYYEKTTQKMLALPADVIAKSISTGRGCKFNCFFCTIPALSGRRIRKTPVADIISLLKKAKLKAKIISFLDNNIYADPVYAKELFKAMIPLKIRWSGSASLDIAKDAEALKLAKRSGCKIFLIGYEISGSSPEQEKKGKFILAHDYIRLSKIIKKTGIGIKAHFIYGFDSDTLKSLFTLWKFCFRLPADYTCLSFLTPLPGTKLYFDKLANNEITNFNWRNYSLSRFVTSSKNINTEVLNWFYPVLSIGFLSTTSAIGFLLINLIVLTYLLYLV